MGKKNSPDKKAGKKKAEKARVRVEQKKAEKKADKKARAKAAKKAAKQAKLRDPGKWKIKSKCCRKNPRCKSCPVVFKRLERAGAFEREDSDFGRELKLARRW